MRKAVPITDNIGFPIMRNGDGVIDKSHALLGAGIVVLLSSRGASND